MFVLWDFNGTLLDDVQAGISSENVLLRRRGLPEFKSVEDYHNVFGFPVIDYYRRVGFDLENESYADIAIEWVEQYMKFSALSKLHDGVTETLEHIKNVGITQLVLSATERNMLCGQLKSLGIYDYFGDENILGLDNIHAGSKAGIAAEWMEKVKPDRALLIGDTEHDFDVARETGMECVLIAIGHQSRKTLEGRGVPVLSGISEVLKYI